MENWTPRGLTPEEIHETLHDATQFGGVVERPLIFSRDQFVIKHLEIQDQEVIMTLAEEIQDPEDSRHLCIHLNYRKMSFILKKNEYVLEGRSIRASLPREARAIMKRPHPRYKLDYQAHPSAITRAERRGGEFELQGFVEDLSLNGMCLLIHSEEGDELKSNDHIWIKSLASQSLPFHIFGKVIYTTHVVVAGKEFLKAGIRLEKELEEEFFNSLIQNHLEILAA